MPIKSFSRFAQSLAAVSAISVGTHTLSAPYDAEMGSVGLLNTTIQNTNKSTDWSKKVITTKKDWKMILDAIRQVETGGKPNRGIGAVGDGGRAIGPFQIHKGYWTDATQYDKSIGGNYESCKTDYDYSVKIVKAYQNRYARGKPLTFEQVARRHNSGPRAMTPSRKHLTDKYWKKVIKELDKHP